MAGFISLLKATLVFEPECEHLDQFKVQKRRKMGNLMMLDVLEVCVKCGETVSGNSYVLNRILPKHDIKVLINLKLKEIRIKTQLKIEAAQVKIEKFIEKFDPLRSELTYQAYVLNKKYDILKKKYNIIKYKIKRFRRIYHPFWRKVFKPEVYSARRVQALMKDLSANNRFMYHLVKRWWTVNEKLAKQKAEMVIQQQINEGMNALDLLTAT